MKTLIIKLNYAETLGALCLTPTISRQCCCKKQCWDCQLSIYTRSRDCGHNYPCHGATSLPAQQVAQGSGLILSAKQVGTQ